MLMSGTPPFYDSSEPRLLRAIMAGKFSFKDKVWEPVSPLCASASLWARCRAARCSARVRACA